MKKGQICYIIVSNDIEPAKFIEKCNSWQVHVKNLENEEEHWISISCVYDTKEQAYTKLLSWLEEDKQEAVGSIEGLKEELDVINKTIRKLKQKYEQ